MNAARTDLRRMVATLGAAARGQRGIMQWVLVLAAAYLLAQTLFIVLTLAAAAVPGEAVLASLATGATQHLWQPIDYPADGIGNVTARFGFAGVSDAFTQCIALTMLVPGGDGVWESAMAGRHLGTCSLAVPAIQELAAGNDAVTTYTYNRYWNGFTILTRPALALGGVGAVRALTIVLLLVALVWAVSTLARRVSPLAPLVLLPVLASTNIMTQPLDAFPHALSFAVILLGTALAARFGSGALPALFLIAALSASLFNFVDFLLNPPVAWSLFVFAAVAARWAAGRGTRSLWAASGVAALGWIVGYGATWITRWGLAVVTFGESAWREILGVISTRLQGQNADLVVEGALQPTIRNTLFWLGTVPTSKAVAAGALLTILVCVVLLAVRRPASLVQLLAMAAPALLVPMWLELLNNHSQIHVFFVYRAIPVAVGIVATAALLAVRTRPSENAHTPSRRADDVHALAGSAS